MSSGLTEVQYAPQRKCDFVCQCQPTARNADEVLACTLLVKPHCNTGRECWRAKTQTQLRGLGA